MRFSRPEQALTLKPVSPAKPGTFAALVHREQQTAHLCKEKNKYILRGEACFVMKIHIGDTLSSNMLYT